MYWVNGVKSIERRYSAVQLVADRGLSYHFENFLEFGKIRVDQQITFFRIKGEIHPRRRYPQKWWSVAVQPRPAKFLCRPSMWQSVPIPGKICHIKGSDQIIAGNLKCEHIPRFRCNRCTSDAQVFKQRQTCRTASVNHFCTAWIPSACTTGSFVGSLVVRFRHYPVA